MPTLDFRSDLVIQCMEDIIEPEPGDIGRHIRACKRPQIVQCKIKKVPKYRGKWLDSEQNKKKIQAEISESALQEPFRIWRLNQDLLHVQQSNASMLWVVFKP